MKALIAFLILTASFVVSAAGAPAQEAQQATDSAADEGDKYWGTECTGPRRDASALTCTATQSIFVAETQQLLFRVKVVTPAGGGEPVMELQGPLNFYLPAGIGLSVDGTELAKIAVSNCNQSGCYGAIKLKVAMIETLKRGSNLRISFLSAPQSQQFVETPLAGFTRAIQAIE